jgi:trimethylamine--corrinoid protein Co-methyltransferase
MALEEYQEPPTDAGIREALEAFMTKRREEIGAGEP